MLTYLTNTAFTASSAPGPVPPPVSTGCSVPASALDVYFIVDCDWERARASTALSFLPFVPPGQMYIMWTGNTGIDPLINPPNGLGLSSRDAVIQMIDNNLRPRICSSSNFLPGQISNALQRVITSQRDRETPFIVHIFTSRTDDDLNEAQLQNSLAQIRTMQQNRGLTNVAYSGQIIPQTLRRLDDQDLLTLNSVYGSAQYEDVLTNTLCSQLQSALGQLTFKLSYVCAKSLFRNTFNVTLTMTVSRVWLK